MKTRGAITDALLMRRAPLGGAGLGWGAASVYGDGDAGDGDSSSLGAFMGVLPGSVETCWTRGGDPGPCVLPAGRNARPAKIGGPRAARGFSKGAWTGRRGAEVVCPSRGGPSRGAISRSRFLLARRILGSAGPRYRECVLPVGAARGVLWLTGWPARWSKLGGPRWPRRANRGPLAPFWRFWADARGSWRLDREGGTVKSAHWASSSRSGWEYNFPFMISEGRARRRTCRSFNAGAR